MVKQKPPRMFKEVFTACLYDRAQISLRENANCRFDEMERDLQRAERLGGLSGDQGVSEDSSQALDMSWSDDAPKLMRMVEKLGVLNANISSEAFLKPFFTHLSLAEWGISLLDKDLLKFSNLTFLDVSRDLLESLDCLPPGLRFLRAYNNSISKVNLRGPPLTSLQFLGLGHNELQSNAMENIGKRFTGLLSLDLSFNNLMDMAPVATHLQNLKQLKQLALLGNPLCLLPHYRLVLSCFLPQVELVDDIPLSEQELQDASLITEAHMDPPGSMGLQIRVVSVRAARKLLIANRAQIAAKLAARKKQILVKEEEKPKEPAEGEEAAADAPADGDGEAPGAPAGSEDAGTIFLRIELPTGETVDTEAMELPPVDEEHPPESEVQTATEEFTLPPVVREIPLSATWTPPVAEEEPPPAPPAAEEGEEGAAAAAEGAGEGEEAAAKPPKMLRVPPSMYKKSAGPPLAEFREWLMRGMRVKLLFRPAPPPAEEAEEGADPAPVQEMEPELIGGAVLPLQDLLTPQQRHLTDELRAAEGGPPVPPPPISAASTKVRCVPYADHWLDPDVQVPRDGVRPKQIAEAGGLNLEVSLWAPVEYPAPASEEEEAT